MKDSDIQYHDTIEFVPPISGGKVIKVYDGDTITIASRLPYAESPLYRFHVRLNGIDTPEIKGHSEHEKELAKKSRDALQGLIMGKYVSLKRLETEKYGRVLADVYLGELNIGDWMLQNNYAVKYNGGKKERPDTWN
jgi:endonuclease YncB( thermonuclease family)